MQSVNTYRTLLQYAKPQSTRLVIILGLTMLAAVFSALQPWPMKILVDHVLAQDPLPTELLRALEFLSIDPATTMLLIVVVLGGLVLFGLNSTIEVALTWLWAVAGRLMVYDLARDLFARLQRRSLLFHRRSSTGDSISRVTEDTWVLYQLVDTLLVRPAYALLTMAGMIYLMSRLNVELTLISLLAAPFMVGASFLLGKRVRAASKAKREVESRINSHIHQILSGIPVVQAFAQEDREHHRFREFADAAIRAQKRTTILSSVNSLSSGLITTLGTGVILWISAYRVIEGQLTLGGLLVFLAYLSSLQGQIRVFASIYTSLQKSRASVDRVMEVLHDEGNVSDRPGAIVVSRLRGEVSFDSVSFGYTEGNAVLREISLNVAQGETLAIVGSTGAGKSTLASLLPRFFDPWEGRVIVDGHDVRDLQLKSLRANIAIVLQEPFLFPFTVAENIAYGRPDATQAEIEAVARAANAHAFIEQMPQGYDTVLGEHGATLSGGERQRLSIARALLKDAPLLILDEPTSALDAETENDILMAMERLMKGRTTLLITHRLSTIRKADTIAVLKDGRLVETGSHQKLLDLQGVYHRLYKMQFGGEVKTAGVVEEER